ncbi:sulfatase [Hyunsoonleella sp. SJ7]|uniref:Sulfatase n=1 Tax=Hyunsoonleella aquatilis TaxID=2762758 RepID=A0A923H833_9FLAO|nr:sulfatase [Hyunsoonleella aquatilis]MBC3758686.1 sulfatase [Hyunsoonleella aquatilis]
MEQIKKQCILFFVVVCLFSCRSKTSEEKIVVQKPNLLFIFADQYRQASLGFLNEDPVYTPNLDKLAKEGVFFSEAVSNNPLCSPYRAMLMTGRYSLSTGVVENCNSQRTEFGNYLKKSEVCISDVLVANGYSAGYVGKWHLDGPEPTPPDVKRVWDTWCPPDRRHGFSFWYAYGTHNRHNAPYYWTTNAKEDEKTYIKKWSAEHEADVIIDYLDITENQRKSKEPFALFWSINPPHTPFTQVPERYKKRYEGMDYKEVLNRPNVQFKDNYELKRGDHGVEKRLNQAKDYFASVNGVDDQIGRVIKKLKEKGLYENTIIVFSADHGEMLGSQGLMHKNVWFKEAYDIPFIVHYPKKLKPKTEDLLISVPDYMPTLLGLMDLKTEIPKAVEGVDYSDVFFDKEVIRPEKQLYFAGKSFASKGDARGFRTKDYTYAVVKHENGDKFHYLYHDAEDPYQMTNIWGENAELDHKMETELTELLTSMNDPW